MDILIIVFLVVLVIFQILNLAILNLTTLNLTTINSIVKTFVTAEPKRPEPNFTILYQITPPSNSPDHNLRNFKDADSVVFNGQPLTGFYAGGHSQEVKSGLDYSSYGYVCGGQSTQEFKAIAVTIDSAIEELAQYLEYQKVNLLSLKLISIKTGHGYLVEIPDRYRLYKKVLGG